MKNNKNIINPMPELTREKESLENISGGLAREFNNMLLIMLGYTHLSLSEDTTPEIKKSLGEIEEAVSRGNSIIQTMTNSLSSEAD